MAQRTLKSIGLTSNSVVFADPLDIGNTVKFTADTTISRLPKGTTARFARVEVLTNRNAIVKKVGCDDCSSEDAVLSVRIKATVLPGHELTQQIIDDSFENAKRAFVLGMLNGFKPGTNDEFVIDFGKS